jgi:hypothetical protein
MTATTTNKPAKTPKPAAPPKPTRVHVSHTLIHDIADALRVNISTLENETLTNADGDPHAAARLITDKLAAANIVLYDRSYRRDIPEDDTIYQLTRELQRELNCRWTQAFRGGAANHLANAAKHTHAITDADRWRIIQDFKDATDALAARPGATELVHAQNKVRAAAVALCLAALNTHFAAFIADPQKEPTYDNAGWDTANNRTYY